MSTLDLLIFPGVLWPLEGIHPALRVISYIMPYALPISALRAIIMKDSKIFEPHVYLAFVSLTVWIIVPIYVCFWLLQEKKPKNDEMLVL